MFLTRRFFPLFITQFFGAFNDNLFKNALVMLLTFKVASYSDNDAHMMVILAGALFMLPYFLFSATAGQFADKIPRNRIARFTKIWELVVVVLGAIGFIGHHPIFLILMLFALGAQSTFFGPVKYALLPQHLREDELLAGNAYIEAGTFLAILLGTICGGVLIMQEQGEWLVVYASLAIAIIGYIASRFIPHATAPQPQMKVSYNIISATWDMVAHNRKNRPVFGCILSISWFWVLGATLLSQIPALVKTIIGANDNVVTLFLTMFSVGIGIGSFLANIISKGKIESRYIPWAAFGMAVFTLDAAWVITTLPPVMAGADLLTLTVYFESFNRIRIAADLCFMAVCAGIFIVPLYAIMQHDSAEETRARTIATNNIVNAFYMVLAAVAVIVLFAVGMSIGQLFILIGIGNVIAGVLILKKRTRQLS